MLNSDEYDRIKADYDRISRQYFPDHYFCPDGMRFAYSEAIFPGKSLSVMLAPQYEAQCRTLCYGPFPSWDKVQTRFAELQSVL